MTDRALNLDVISLAEPLACCLNGQELTAVCEGDVVLIIGGGPIGCLHAALAELRGAEKIIVAEKLENRIGIIKRHTACRVLDVSMSLQEAVIEETCGKGVDVILMATPEVGIDNSLLKLLAPGGRICIFSGPRSGDYEKTIDVRSMHYRELTIVGSLWMLQSPEQAGCTATCLRRFRRRLDHNQKDKPGEYWGSIGPFFREKRTESCN